MKWQCVVRYAIGILLVVLVIYLVCRQPPSQMSLRLASTTRESYNSATCPTQAPNNDWTDCKQIDVTCRMMNGADDNSYCECMTSLGCKRDWCHCLTVVNKCAAESQSRAEFCKCIKRSDCADQVPCEENTNLDCGRITTLCNMYYPYNPRACVLYHGCKPYSDPICQDCKSAYAADPFGMGACLICRGCQADEQIYGDQQAQGKLPQCSEIPAYVTPKPTKSPSEMRELEYLRINRQCGLTDKFNFPGEYFKDPDEKYCYCCVGRALNDNKFDNCNCNNAEDCLNLEMTAQRCGGFMQKYGITPDQVPTDVNVVLSKDLAKAVRGNVPILVEPTTGPTTAPPTSAPTR